MMPLRMNRLLLALAILAVGSERLHGQRPEPGTAPVTRGDPTVPPLPVSDPGIAPPVPSKDPQIAPQPPVQPGTILHDPAGAAPATRQLRYAPAGEAPGEVKVTATAPRTVSLSWTAPKGASGYWIYQQGPGQTTFYQGGSLVTETSGMVTGLLPATSYSFKVSAVYPQEAQLGAGLSGPVTVNTAPAPVPTGLSASIVGRGQVSLRWDGIIDADGFRLSRDSAPISDIKRMSYTGGTSLATTAGDSVMPGTHQYQIQSVYRPSGGGPGEVLSALSQPVSVVIPASSRVRYCQTRAGRTRCAPPEIPSVTLAARKSP